MTALARKLCESTSLHAANDNHSVDAEDGNYYNYFRDYDPTTGRYLQTDTIGQNGGLNLYKYAESNPLRYTDRRGQSVLDSILIIYFGFGSCRPSDPILNNDETADKPPPPDCKKEQRDADEYCRELENMPPASRPPGLWGGSFGQCWRGQVSYLCGGNKP
jgi:RHS repeat-associated protein